MRIPLFSTGAERDEKFDFAVLIWTVVFVLWAIATLGKWNSGSWELADIPSGLSAVLVVLPIAKGVAIAVNAFRKPQQSP